MNQDDILFSASKFFFAYGLGNSFLYPPGVGASVVLLSDRPKPEVVFETINKYRPTVLFSVPTLYANMLDIGDVKGKYDISSLRLCTSAGEALPKEIYYEWKERFGLEILDGIGSTELLHIFISNRPAENVRNEVSVIMGFPMKDNSEPKAEIGGTTFDLVAKGSNAWVKNPAEEGQFIEAMRRGSRLTVKATSVKGNTSTDTYSLSGLSDALARVQKECQ